MDTELFDTFCSLERLRASPDILAAVMKSLNPSIEVDEALMRFANFMGAFKDALQLDSDTSDENAEHLSPEEIEILRGFLTLSSLNLPNMHQSAAKTDMTKYKLEHKTICFWIDSVRLKDLQT